MTDENNVTQNQVGIMTENGVRSVDVKLLRDYKDEAFKYLNTEANAKASFKDTVEAMNTTFDIPKKDISKWLKARYNEKVKEMSDQISTLEALDAAIEGNPF